ncbi:MAG TPA: lytic transglycosylase domain-containing protein, partial [Solirubrobacterales bacterium]
MRTKVATILFLAALLAIAATAGATMAGAAPVSPASRLGPKGVTTTVIPNPSAPACSNGIDDDGDGLVDMEDPDCESPEDTTEEPPSTSTGTTTAPSMTTTTPETTIPPAPATTTTPPIPPTGKPEKEQGQKDDSGEAELKQGETIGGGRQPEIRGGVVHNQSLGDSSGGGRGGGAGAVEAPSATGGGDQPLSAKKEDGGSQFNEGGEPTLANPTTTIAPFGPAPIGVPNFVIDSFEIPPFLLPIYQACGTEYGIPWEVLAAINKIETGFGTNLNVSSAGAVGWMQFLPSSWEMYGLDANGDGRKDPYNPVDAICAAAHYLKIAGGDKNLYKAIFSYNHADWYVQEVL